MSFAVGIDFGTTNSLVAIARDGDVEVVPNERGDRLTPSVVSFDGDDILIGRSAWNRIVSVPERTFREVKRHMGTGWSASIDGHNYSAAAIAGRIIARIRSDAERGAGRSIDRAVLTVPAHFGDRARNATVEAAGYAGIEVLRLINEPTAAAFGYAGRLPGRSNILVFDLGGGTFDVTCLRRDGGRFDVLATTGDGAIGGGLFTRRLLDYVAVELSRQLGVPVDAALEHALLDQVEKVKVELSETPQTTLTLPFVGTGSGARHFALTVERDRLEDLIADAVRHTIDLSRETVEAAGFGELDAIVLSGGATRMPIVRRGLADLFPDVEIVPGVNPDEAVVRGAAAFAHEFVDERTRFVVNDVSGYTLGIETIGARNTILIPRNSPLPTTAQRRFTTVEDGQSTVEIHVLQGDAAAAADTVSLGRFILSGLRPAARGEVRVAVTFHLDEDGILRVRARDEDTDRYEEIVVTVQDLQCDGDEVRVRRLIARLEAARDSLDPESDLLAEVEGVIVDASDALERGESVDDTIVSLEAVLLEIGYHRPADRAKVAYVDS